MLLAFCDFFKGRICYTGFMKSWVRQRRNTDETSDRYFAGIGSVGWSPEAELIGCSMYRWARFPQVKEVCVLDQGGEYPLYQECGTDHAPNGTGIPVTEVEGEVLSAPGILREDFEQPTDAREVLLDIGGDGEEERLVIGKEGSFLYVVEEGKTWALSGLPLP